VSKLRAFVSTLGALQNQHRSLRQHVYATEAVLAHVSGGDFFRILECEFDIVAQQQGAKSRLSVLAHSNLSYVQYH
jgi:hypothetical protein